MAIKHCFICLDVTEMELFKFAFSEPIPPVNHFHSLLQTVDIQTQVIISHLHLIKQLKALLSR